MINSRRLAAMVRKWQKVAALGKRRITMSRTSDKVDSGSCKKSVSDKGHFVAYTIDGRRFMIPLSYLKSPIFIELLRMSEDEYGVPCSGPITLPCDAIFMEYIVSLVQRRMSSEEAKALLISIANCRCSTSSMLHQGVISHQILVHGF